MSNETLYLLLPEIILVLLATAIYLGGAFLPDRAAWGWLAGAAIVLAAVALYQQGRSEHVQAALENGRVVGAVAVDSFSTMLGYGALAAGLVFVMIASRWSRHGEPSEFMGSLLLIVAGLMLIPLAADLVTLFVALELVSIPTYVILFLGRSTNILESGTKYFFLSVLSSALVLYGFSFLYGAAGSTTLVGIERALTVGAAVSPDPAAAESTAAESSAEAALQPATPLAPFASLALILIFAGLAFRLTAVPFHFYAPDVYQGTTNPNAGLLAVAPKIAGLGALARLAFLAPGLEQLGWQLSLAIAIVTMSLGNLLALWQTNVRRLMAYSSIAHAGYMLIGLAVGFATARGASEAEHFDGVGATFFYLLVYSAATAGTFAALSYLSSARRQVDTLDDLAGLAANHPKTAGAIALFMFSLTGLPPLAGFWGKFMLFTGALGVDSRPESTGGLASWFVALAIIGVVNAAISAAYYLRVVGVMFFRPATARLEARGGPGAAWAMVVCAAAVIGIGCFPGAAIEEATRASQSSRATFVQSASPAETKVVSADGETDVPAPIVRAAAAR